MTRKTSSSGPLHGAGKWITATITTGAALAALLVNARNLGMSQYLGMADLSARRVWITPRRDTLLAIGDSTQLAATVTDKLGATLTGVTLAWRTDDPTIATVDSSGLVVGRGPGTARVTAAVRDLVGEARVIVRQHPTRVEIPGDTVVRLLEGDTVPFAAQALDARGYPIREMVPHWHTADSQVVAVDSLGRAIALAPGWTTLSAETAGYEAHIAVRVDLAPAIISAMSGDGQRAPAGKPLPQPVIVEVLSRGGTPVPGVAVTFASADGEGRAKPDTVVTGRDGHARTAWTLASRPGRQHLVATAAMLDSTLTITAEADPVPRNTKVTPEGGPFGGAVGETLGEPVAVRVTDSAGVALADVPVAWTALDKGAVEAIDTRTDSLGTARVRWTLGPAAGEQRARVQVGNPRTLPPTTITALASAGAPAQLVVAAGQGQRGPVGAALPKPIVIAVRDAHGNGVAGVAVRLRTGHGTVGDSAPTTDSTGRVKVRWTLGREPGTGTVRVRAVGVDSGVTVTATAIPGSAANISLTNPPANATAGVAVRITAAVTDAYGNPVANAAVVFGVGAGRLLATRVMSDAKGQASTRWTPGAAGGDQVVTATLRGTKTATRHTVSVAAPPKRKS